MPNTPVQAAGEALPKYKPPTDKELLEALEPVDWKVAELRRAAMVADEYVHMELAAGNCGRFTERCDLTPAQVDGILYMLNHVRELAAEIEKLTDKAYGRETRA